MFLNCHSTYSLRYGTLSPKMLVERAQKLGIKQLVLTDINNTSAAVEFYISCRAANIKPIIGIEFRKNNKTLYIGIAHNIRGFKSLNDYYTSIQYGEREMDFYAPRLDDVYIIYPYLVKPIEDFREEEFLGIRPQYLHRLFRSTVKKRMDRLVVLHSVTFANQQGYELHKILRAIDYNCLISQLTQKDIAHPNEILLSSEDAIKPYAAYPQIVANTQRLLNKCEIVLKQGFSLNRQYFSKSPKDDLALLKKLAHKGCKRRYGEDHYGAFERLSQELKVIEKQSFTSYFLITWDIIRYAQISGYYHVGRGSGANSIVAYCLYITDVDPLELDLYFERFINPYRISPPDFDIDFSWDERDDVTEYIFDRYGREYVALLATYVTFSGRSIIREIGKVYGLPKEEIDKIISGQVSLEQMHPQWKKIRQYGSMMEGIPNYLSIHAGGVLISERPLAYSSALEMMPKGFPVVHFDMHHAEDWGYHKYDILSQRGLGHIKDAVSLVKSNQGKSVDIRDISKIKSDARVRDKLREGQCLGCFYIESPAMRGLLSKLRCDRYIDLVAASSIIRPGVAKSGMMRAYIERYHAPYSFEYLHPVFEEHLGETFGVMVYQEDVMKIAHHFAGLDLDESDVLRRLMSGKKTKGDTFERLKQKFFDNCALKQHDIKLSEEVWRQIESFAGYSFCKAHSASYAVESMQSLYLKTYFPVEFMVAVINNFGGFYRTQYYLHEAYMSGAVLHPPCVNHSELLTGLEGRDVYLGFGLIDSLERTTIKKIFFERRKSGEYKSLSDFVRRVLISATQLELLIRVGAFRFTDMSKYELMWEKNALHNPHRVASHHQAPPLFDLDASSGDTYQLPNLSDHPDDQAFDELELLGFFVRLPFDLLAQRMPSNAILVSDFVCKVGSHIAILGYYVCQKKLRTSQGKAMAFGTWVDREGRYFDTTHFPIYLRKYPFSGQGIYLIQGKLTQEFGFPSIEVTKLNKLPYRTDSRLSMDG